MSFEDHECYCTVKLNTKSNRLVGDTTTMDYKGNGVWECPKCSSFDSSRKASLKATVEMPKKQKLLYH
jgi:hypothetical protein